MTSNKHSKSIISAWFLFLSFIFLKRLMLSKGKKNSKCYVLSLFTIQKLILMSGKMPKTRQFCWNSFFLFVWVQILDKFSFFLQLNNVRSNYLYSSSLWRTLLHWFYFDIYFLFPFLFFPSLFLSLRSEDQ